MFSNLEVTKKNGLIDLTLEVKQHILSHRDKSIAGIRHNEPYNGSYLSSGQIKSVLDLARKIGAEMDRLAKENSKLTKINLVEAIEIDDELVDDCVNARLADATEDGTYVAYMSAINSDNTKE